MQKEKFDPEIISDLKFAGTTLKEGGLVSFPTETVYGLGANGLNQLAIESIFKAKGRPSNDPLILHVKDFQSIVPLVNESTFILDFCEFLTKKFWPGPLSLVLQKSAIVPDLICANTGWVAVRCPQHPQTLNLLQELDFPLAGPSANLFGHVSPTTALHVLQDFKQNEYKVYILDGGQCTQGIESTVIKVAENKEFSSIELNVFRQGSTQVSIIEEFIQSNWTKCKVEIKVKQLNTNQQSLNDQKQTNYVSPGQLLQHYSPKIPCFLFMDFETFSNISIQKEIIANQQKIVLIDFGQQVQKHLQAQGQQIQFLAIFDLSEQCQIQQAQQNLYDILRQSEIQENCNQILIYAGSFKDQIGCEAIYDRIFRAASGKILQVLDSSQENQLTESQESFQKQKRFREQEQGQCECFENKNNEIQAENYISPQREEIFNEGSETELNNGKEPRKQKKNENNSQT